MKNIKISMTSKGRCLDNILSERLWRTIKYEDVYIKKYETGLDAKNGLEQYLSFYNKESLHQSLNYKTPLEGYCGGNIYCNKNACYAY